MPSPSAVIRSFVQRALVAPLSDDPNIDRAPALWPDASLKTQPMIRKAHALADEGSYYVCTNAQTGIVPTYGTALVATSPFITIFNANPAGGPRIYLDYIALTVMAALVNTTAIGYKAVTVVVDNINRFTSGGTALTPQNSNMLVGNTPGAVVNCGAIVAPAASAFARTLVGTRNLRNGISTTVGSVIGDTHILNFGGVENNSSGNVSVTAAVAVVAPQSMPPVMIPPGSTGLIYLYYPVLTAPSAETLAPDIGFWMR